MTLEDDEGRSPLEHAIMSDASTQTAKLLQHANRVGMMKINQLCLEQSEDEAVAAELNKYYQTKESVI